MKPAHRDRNPASLTCSTPASNSSSITSIRSTSWPTSSIGNASSLAFEDCYCPDTGAPAKAIQLHGRTALSETRLQRIRRVAAGTLGRESLLAVFLRLRHDATRGAAASDFAHQMAATRRCGETRRDAAGNHLPGPLRKTDHKARTRSGQRRHNRAGKEHRISRPIPSCITRRSSNWAEPPNSAV